MEPQVQYTKTSDGVDIAFASMGEGPPLVVLPLPGMAHVQRIWEMFPNLLPPLTRTFRLIWYDSRGTGLSERDKIDFSMEAMMRDLEAVIDCTGLRSFAVLAFQDTVPMAVTFATTFPVTVRLERTVEGLRPGMAAEVAFRFESTDRRERVIVPLVAVGEDRNGRFVFVVQRVDSITGVVLRRPVTVGELTTDEGFEILEGLVDGELVVTAGISRIADSMRVSLPRPTGAGS